MLRFAIHPCMPYVVVAADLSWRTRQHTHTSVPSSDITGMVAGTERGCCCMCGVVSLRLLFYGILPTQTNYRTSKYMAKHHPRTSSFVLDLSQLIYEHAVTGSAILNNNEHLYIITAMKYSPRVEISSLCTVYEQERRWMRDRKREQQHISNTSCLNVGEID